MAGPPRQVSTPPIEHGPSDHDATAHPPSDEGLSTEPLDRVIAVPLAQLFAPDPDPTREFPQLGTEIEGYVVTPGPTVTVALTAPVPEGVDLLDSIWSALRRRGFAQRRMVLLDERGRMVSLMTLRLRAPKETMRLFQSLLLVPVHAQDGVAEVHFWAGARDLKVLEQRMRQVGPPFPLSTTLVLPPARGNGGLHPDEWAFLGLLAAMGVLDGTEGPTPQAVAECLGIDTATLTERARAVERGLEEVVSGLFSWSGPGASAEGVPS